MGPSGVLPVRHEPSPTEALIACAFVRGCTLSEACGVLGYDQGGADHKAAYDYVEACRDVRTNPWRPRQTYLTDYDEAVKEAFERLQNAN